MKDTASKALLPIGLHDTLAPNAEREATIVSTLLTRFYRYGYAQVAPPMAEFEDTLLAGVGASEGPRMFRLMDPASKKMLGIRTDITTQIADKLGLDPAIVTRSISTLTTKGLTTTQVHPTDQRSKSVHITEKGRLLCDELIAVLRRFDDYLGNLLDKSESEMLSKILNKLLIGSRVYRS